MNKRKQATHTCPTCKKNDISATDIALLRMKGRWFGFTCTAKNSEKPQNSNSPRFSRKNCPDYAGESSGRT